MIECIKWWEQDVLNLSLEHLKDSAAWSDEYYPLGGFHIKPRPEGSYLDAIEINLLCCHLNEQTDEYDEDEEMYLEGTINVNIFHTDVGRIYSLSEVLDAVMDDAIMDGFVFRKDFVRLFRQGKYLRCNNLRYDFSMTKSEFENKYILFN